MMSSSSSGRAFRALMMSMLVWMMPLWGGWEWLGAREARPYGGWVFRFLGWVYVESY